MKYPQIHTRYLENGIEFQSHISPKVFYDTAYAEDGTILHNISSDPNLIPLPQMHVNPQVVVIDVLFILFAFFSGKPSLVVVAFIFSFFLSSRLDKLGKQKTSKSAKFHAAKHKVFNAWETLNYERIPTLEEAKKASVFSMNCSDNTLLNDCLFIMVQLIIGVLAFKHFIFLMILGFLNVVLCRKIRDWGLNQYLQVFSISKPSDRELKLVLEALAEYVRAEFVLIEDSNRGAAYERLSVEDVIIDQEAYKKASEIYHHNEDKGK